MELSSWTFNNSVNFTNNSDWIFEGMPFTEAPKKYVGFVYEIINLKNNKKYIGKKLFWCKRKRKTIESNWKKYYSSNKELIEISKTNPEILQRRILKIFAKKGEVSYYEAKLQFENDVLLNDNYYNKIIHCRINANHL